MAPRLRESPSYDALSKYLWVPSISIGDVWAIKEVASKPWHYKSKTWGMNARRALCEAARKRENPALDKVIDTILRHLIGVANAITLKSSNAASESANSRVQALRKRANGYRSTQRFRDAIMSRLGGLDLYPRPAATRAIVQVPWPSSPLPSV